MNEKVGPFLEHLHELRRVLIISAIAVLAGTVISYAFYLDTFLNIIVSPLNKLGKELIFLGVTEGFMTQLKVAIFGGVLIASPVIMWQILGFIMPALYSHEKKVFLPLFLLAILLFVTGIAFGYIFVLELGLKVLLVDFSAGLTAMISVSKYVSFVIAFLLPFGFVFEIPLITYFLTRLGIVTPKFLREKRRFVVLGMFVLAAVLSPGGDVIAQLFLAIPMLILYEISIFISTAIYKPRPIEHDEEETQESTAVTTVEVNHVDEVRQDDK